MGEEIRQDKKKKSKINFKKRIIVSVLVIVGLLLVMSGGSVLYYNINYTDDEGYSYSNIYHVNTSTYAFAAYMNEYKISTWGFLGANNVAQIKFIATPTDPTKELFIGYATTEASQTYADSFELEIPTWWQWWAEQYYAEISINSTTIAGSGAPQLPQNQAFWLASDQSHGTVTMTYLPQNEQHVWFIMNSDGSRNISADIQIAFKSPILTVLPTILISAGLVFIVIGLYFFIRRNKKKL